MKIIGFVGLAVAVAMGAGCESVAQSPLGGGSRHTMQVDDFKLTMNWCELLEDRSVECEFEMTSLYQDRRAGLYYPKVQDDRGGEYNLTSKDMPVGGKTMIAGEAYFFIYTAENLPTYATEVRGVTSGFVAQRGGNKPGVNQQLVFADIPRKPVVVAAAAAPVATPAPVAETAAAAVPVATPDSGSVSDTFWHGIIVPVVAVPEDDIMRLWKRGAYIHFREDGAAGYNWSTPGPYIYDAVNKWSQDGAKFTLEMSGARYTFDPDFGDGAKLEAFLEPGGAFKMTMARKDKGAQ